MNLLVFDEVRRQCRRVADQARHVRIVHENIVRFVRPRVSAVHVVPQLDTQTHFVGCEADTVAFFLTLAAVNFGSGYFPHLRKFPGRSGYFTIAGSLARRFRTAGPYTAAELAAFTPQDCAKLFEQDAADAVVGELMTLFARAWNDLGTDLELRFGGDFSACVAAADHCAATLVDLLAEQPMFQDVENYHGQVVPFYKRSQLLASDLALALSNVGLGRFDDLNRLTLFADNLVPHVLRVEGILQYAPRLLAHIENSRLLPAGSEEEVEIRACSVHAVELLIHAAADLGATWSAREVDQLLWHTGQDAAYKLAGKRHRTRTVFY